MEQGAYAAQLLAAILYIIAGARLIRLSQRTGEAPERLLGLYFTASGIAYLGWTGPFILNLGPRAEAVDFTAWALYSAGVIPCVVFIRRVFRPNDAWAGGLVFVCTAALALAAGVLTARGDRYPSLDEPFFWVQWVGYTTPNVWLAVEALLAYGIAAKRARIGLSEPLVANRYLLFGIFGVLQVLACLSDIPLAAEMAADHAASPVTDAVLGSMELASIASLWIAFFPPSAYLKWVTGSTPAPAD
jgi:hypothetical protein